MAIHADTVRHNTQDEPRRAQIDGVIEMLENQPGIRFEDYVVYHSENGMAVAPPPQPSASPETDPGG
jgi:hypothetical protein